MVDTFSRDRPRGAFVAVILLQDIVNNSKIDNPRRRIQGVDSISMEEIVTLDRLFGSEGKNVRGSGEGKNQEGDGTIEK